jgi:hypothetical protein
MPLVSWASRRWALAAPGRGREGFSFLRGRQPFRAANCPGEIRGFLFGVFTWPGESVFLPAMPNRGKRIGSPLHKVQHVSPDDVQALVIERDRLAAMDDRTDAERWLGDPPPHRSALAQRKQA